MSTQRLVIAYHPSATGRRACRAGAALATALDAEAHLVLAFSDGARGALEITEQRRRAEHRLDEATRRYFPNAARVHQHALPEPPVAAVLRVATEARADIVVVGNQRSQGTRRVLGSVATAIIAHADCDVLVVNTNAEPTQS